MSLHAIRKTGPDCFGVSFVEFLKRFADVLHAELVHGLLEECRLADQLFADLFADAATDDTAGHACGDDDEELGDGNNGAGLLGFDVHDFSLRVVRVERVETGGSSVNLMSVVLESVLLRKRREWVVDDVGDQTNKQAEDQFGASFGHVLLAGSFFLQTNALGFLGQEDLELFLQATALEEVFDKIEHCDSFS